MDMCTGRVQGATRRIPLSALPMEAPASDETLYTLSQQQLTPRFNLGVNGRESVGFAPLLHSSPLHSSPPTRLTASATRSILYCSVQTSAPLDLLNGTYTVLFCSVQYSAVYVLYCTRTNVVYSTVQYRTSTVLYVMACV